MTHYVDPADYGFLPEASGIENRKALQKALDIGGTVTVTKPGIYDISGTVFIGGNTTLNFGAGVALRKVNEEGVFSHIILNKGALTKTYDEHIQIHNLSIIVNGMDERKFLVFGLHGQVAFFYVKDLRISGFRCNDLGKSQYAIHICTFEDIILEDITVKGDKDGIHLGRGKRFTIRDCVFDTFDDAIALNAHDYDVGNPELGWIEDGLIENCHDCYSDKYTGYFCRILAGAWVDWYPGIKVRKSDTVVCNGKLYRVRAEADGREYISVTKPTHEKGECELDGITWVLVQNDAVYSAGVKNIIFNNIFLSKPRIAFSVHFDNNKYSRSYYPNAEIPLQENISINNIHIKYHDKHDLLSIYTPVDGVIITNSYIRNNPICFYSNDAMNYYMKTNICISSCFYQSNEENCFLVNEVDGKEIYIQMHGNYFADNHELKIESKSKSIRINTDDCELRIIDSQRE